MQLVQICRRCRYGPAIVGSSKENKKEITTMKNRVIKGLVITSAVLATLTIGGSIVIGGVIADKILHQNKDNDTKSNSVKQLELWGYDLDAFNSTYTGTKISATASDGNVVPGTLFEQGSDTCIILVHGAGGDRVCTYPLAEGYLQDGYDVIAIDQRGCGDNEDDRVTFGINESLDVEAMVAHARDLGYGGVVVHGQSMGAQTTVIYASNVTPGEAGAADAVICDSPVPGMELILRLMFGESEENAYSPLVNYLIFTSKTFMNTFDGIDYDDGDTIAAASRIEIPALIIVSDQDEVCLPHYVEDIYDNITSDGSAIMHVDSAHIEGIIDDPDGYMDGVESFLQQAGV